MSEFTVEKFLDYIQLHYKNTDVKYVDETSSDEDLEDCCMSVLDMMNIENEFEIPNEFAAQFIYPEDFYDEEEFEYACEHAGENIDENVAMEYFRELISEYNLVEVLKDYLKNNGNNNKNLKEETYEEVEPNKELADKAWMLNLIISNMNNEEAYYGGWLYIWPDGESKEECLWDFGDEESYKELEDTFIRKYKAYHEDGLYGKYLTQEIIDAAHEWDNKLGLSPIEVL